MAFPNPWHTPDSVISGEIVGDFVYFNDWVSGSYENGGTIATTAELGDWLSTETNQGAVVIGDDEPGGVLHVTTDTADNDGYEFQLNGESFKVADGKDIYFECRMKLTAAAAPLTSIDWYVGLATTDTTVLDGTTERIGLGSNGLDAGSADIYYVVEDASTETTADTGVNYVDDTYVTLAFHVLGNGRVKFFVNGAEKANVTTNIPDGDAVTLTIAIQNNAAAAKQMLVDYIYCAQKR